MKVQANGSNTCIWTFDTNVASVGPGTGVGFNADGEDGIAVTLLGAKIVGIDYPSSKNVGDGWDVIPPTDGVQFVGGGVLGAASGALVA